MTTIEELEQLIAAAERAGYRTRYDYFGGTGGGICEFGGTKWLFLDLALNSMEQLEQVRAELAKDPSIVLPTHYRAA